MNRSQRILVVDDQPEIAELASMVLAGAGYATATAASGDQALERLRGGGFDLVLLDINMPGKDGWETLRLIRADPELEGVPVAMFSVKGEVSDKVLSMQEGASGYITKPFEVDELVARVERLLDVEPTGVSR